MTDAAGEQRVEGFKRLREQERSMPLSSGQLWTGEDVDLILARLQAVEAEREAKQVSIELLADQTQRALQQRDEAWAEFDGLEAEVQRLTAEVARLRDVIERMKRWEFKSVAEFDAALTPPQP